MSLRAKTILRDALGDFRRTWPQLTVSDLMARLVAATLLMPLVGLLLKLFLETTETGVVTDEAVLAFLMHPTGVLALLVITSVSLAILFTETGQLMVIGHGAVENRRVSWLAALRYTVRHAGGLAHFAGLAVPRLLLIILPFLAAVGAMYVFLLQGYDINYYLAEKPPVFVVVAVFTGLLVTVMAWLLLRRLASWMLALPMVLFEQKNGREAMRASVKVTAPHQAKLTFGLLGWIAGVGLLYASVTFLIGQLGDLLVRQQGANLAWRLVGLAVVIVLVGLANLAVSVFTTTLFPLVVVRVYRALAGPGELRPEFASEGALGEHARWRLPGKPVLAACVLVFSGVASGGYLMLRNLDAGEDAVIIAHRGGAAVAPENTMASFQRSMEDGADWLELDVQENADGTMVVAHDRDFMRVAGSNLQVHQAADADLGDLDVGSFFDSRFSEQRVPSLREVLELAREQGNVGVFIELKYYGHNRHLEAKVVELVEAIGMTSNSVIMSLNYDGVRKTAALRPTWTYGLLNAVAIGDLTRLDVDFLALTANAASHRMIRRAHQRGMKVYVWTVNDPVQMSMMMSRGADGIITDEVALAAKVREWRETLTPLGRFLLWLAGETGILEGSQRKDYSHEIQ